MYVDTIESRLPYHPVVLVVLGRRHKFLDKQEPAVAFVRQRVLDIRLESTNTRI